MKQYLSVGALCFAVAYSSFAQVVNLQVKPAVSNQVQLTWLANSNYSQTLYHTTNLAAPGAWTELLRPNPAPLTNAPTTNILASARPADFFRLQLDTLTNSPVPVTPGQHLGLKLTSGRLTRTYRLFIPTTYNPTNTYAASPLALILHGGGQSADLFADLHPALFSVAQSNAMILALPDATPRDDSRSWAVNPPRPYEAAIDDAQFLLDLVAVLKCELNLDPTRVYAGGFSSGGQMTHQLGARTTNTFAAFAAVGATIAEAQGTNALYWPPMPLEPYPFLIVNASNDCVRPYYGGINVDGAQQAAALAGAVFWVTNNGCTTNVVNYFTVTAVATNRDIFRFETECYPPKSTNANALVTNTAVLARFNGCGNHKVVDFVSLTDGGHNWPDANDNVGFDANAQVLGFFLLHARSNYVASAWNGQWKIAATPVVLNGGTVNVQLTVQNPGSAILPCARTTWFNHGEFAFNVTSNYTAPAYTNNDGDLIFHFDWLPGYSALTLTASSTVNVTIPNGQEFVNVTSTVSLFTDGVGNFTGVSGGSTNVTVKVLASLDYGDAPAPFPTLYADNGARHSPSALKLGALRDVESDGIPSANANGDDATGSDDEDGVTFLNSTTAGQVTRLGIVTSANGYVDAWCDYNRNGSWLDGNEQVFKKLAVPAGSNVFNVLLPANLSPGATYWRFRISSAGDLAPTGYASDGEVEDYATTLLANPNGSNTNAGLGHVDWGDAPTNYPVLAINHGASHHINDGLCLGAGVDAETNGQPHINALGDDNNGDDEDGVAFGALNRSTNVLVLSTVFVNVVGQGYLNAWIDINGDGDWDDAGEQIATSLFITFGGNPNVIQFHIPNAATTNPTFARFRFGVEAAVPPTGGAGDGEVEDYRIVIP